MAQAFKYDRCEKLIGLSSPKLKIAVKNMTIPLSDVNMFDLCDNCSREFDEFLKEPIVAIRNNQEQVKTKN